jgi:hypothetical protein
MTGTGQNVFQTIAASKQTRLRGNPRSLVGTTIPFLTIEKHLYRLMLSQKASGGMAMQKAPNARRAMVEP